MQTGGDGRAQILMIDGSTLSIRPNSTIVIRDSASIFGGSDVRVSLDEGGVNVKTEEQTENTKNVVEVQESENRLGAKTVASFRINENSGGEIRVSRGNVETNVGGSSTVLQGDEYAAVKSGQIQTKEQLLKPPNLVAPRTSEQISANADGKANVSMRWQNTDGTPISKYHLQVSTLQTFPADLLVVERDSLSSNGFSYGNFTPGNYYWRVRTVAASGQASDWSEPQRFAVAIAKVAGKSRRTNGKPNKSAEIFTSSKAKQFRERVCKARGVKFSRPQTAHSACKSPRPADRQISLSATKEEIAADLFYH